MHRSVPTAGLVAALVLATGMLAAGAPAPVAAAEPATSERPNIVVFYIDDTAPHDGRLWENPALTPAIFDTFVEQGLKFTNAIGEFPLCCPARGNLLTGLHAHNNGVTANDARLFNPQMHIGRALKDAGYASMWIGKYLNKNSLLSEDQWRQHMDGWSVMDVVYGWNGDFLGYYLKTKDNGRVWQAKYHSTVMVGDRAVQRMREVPADKPIFQVLSIYNMHADNIPAPQTRERYAQCDAVPPYWTPAFNEEDVSDKPAWIRDLPQITREDGTVVTEGWPMVGYCREMLGVDDVVAKVTAELRAQGRYDNTLMVFTADNGMDWGAHRRRQQKQTPYSTPVPLYMTWPAAWGAEPRVVDEWTSNIDLAPTFCELAGCALGPFPDGQNGPDGASLVPVLDAAAQGNDATLGRDALLEQTALWTAVRTTDASPLGLWHYVEHMTGEKELYDLSGGSCSDWRLGMPGDPCELNNIAAHPKRADLVAQLSLRLAQLRQEGVVRSADASIAKAQAGPYAGVDVYASTPLSSQTQKRLNVRRNTAYDYFVAIRNDEEVAQDVIVRASSNGSSSMTVSYLLGGVRVTSQVTAGGLTLRLAVGQSRTLVVRIYVKGTAGPDAVRRALVTVRPIADDAVTDLVRAIARR